MVKFLKVRMRPIAAPPADGPPPGRLSPGGRSQAGPVAAKLN